VQLFFECGEGRICVTGRSVKFEPTFGEAIGEELLEGFASGAEITMGGSAEWRGSVALWRKVEGNGLPFFPVGRDLENGGSAKAAMSEKHFFAKRLFCGGGDDFGRDAGELGITTMIRAIEDEGNESGTRGNDFVAELTSEVVTKGRGSHFGDGEAASGND
jgi:hypothetical protein